MKTVIASAFVCLVLASTLIAQNPTALIRLLLSWQQTITAGTACVSQIILAGVVDTKLCNIPNLVYQNLGQQECNGADGITGLPLFSIIFGILNNDPNADFSGHTLCDKSCRGTCAVYQNISQAPVSAYPFGCNCASTGCDANGPIRQPNFISNTEIRCDLDARCDCSIQFPNTPSTGYLCNWWNVNLNQTIDINYNPGLSPIRWCDCCPNA